MTNEPFDEIPLTDVLTLAQIAIPCDPQLFCCMAIEIMPLALTLLREWCLLDNPGETAEQALTFAHFAGR
jgi:hypothetical protein